MNILSGVTPKSLPLFSFHTLIDEDMGVLRYVLSNYKDSDIFDIDTLKNVTSSLSITGDIYRRKYSNPLYYIMKDEKYTDLLDRCYDEYLSEHEAEILDNSISTEIVNLIVEFDKSSEIEPTILYYTDAQLEALNSIPELEPIKKIFIDSISQDTRYSCYYFKYISELENFDYLKETTIYFSSCGINLDDTNQDFIFDNDQISEFIKRRIYIGIFDLYRMKLIGEYQYDN